MGINFAQRCGAHAARSLGTPVTLNCILYIEFAWQMPHELQRVDTQLGGVVAPLKPVAAKVLAGRMSHMTRGFCEAE